MPTATQTHPADVEPQVSVAAPQKSPDEERRGSRRASRKLIAKVKTLGRGETYSGLAEDVSESGLYLHVPFSQGLAVGQRCEVNLEAEDGSTLACLAGESCYATVVRTEVITAGARELLGAGMRFDQPLFF